MRIFWKLAVLVAVGVGIQMVIAGELGRELDEAQFTARAWSNSVIGHPTDAEIMRAADRLLEREQARGRARLGSAPRPPPSAPVRRYMRSENDPA
jgi:hypothetical protein